MEVNQTIWPSLSAMRASAFDLEARREFIGGSDANAILSGDADKIEQLWLEKRGKASPPDLSDKLQVMLGCWSEPFNRHWYEKLTGYRLVRVAQTIVSPEFEWRRCTLDGFVETIGAVWEAKHTNAFTSVDQLLERYMPQLQHNMAVTGSANAVLSVIFGNHKYEIIEVPSDWLYQQELFTAEECFWNCVQTGKTPVPVEPPPPPKPVGTREVCLEGSNSWASAAVEWLQHREAAKAHAAACGLIKELVDEDVSRAFGHGIEAKRSKSGAITIRELA